MKNLFGRRATLHWMVRILPFILLVLLTVENIFLILRNNELRKEIARLSMQQQVLSGLALGDTVQSFVIKTLDGDSIGIYNGDISTKYLLFVFAPDCPHCKNSIPQWNYIAELNNETENRYVVGISLSSAEDARHFVMQGNVRFLVATTDEVAFKKSHKTDAVPQTLIISGKGVVEKFWVGELSSEDANEVKKSFTNGSHSQSWQARKGNCS